MDFDAGGLFLTDRLARRMIFHVYFFFCAALYSEAKHGKKRQDKAYQGEQELNQFLGRGSCGGCDVICDDLLLCSRSGHRVSIDLHDDVSSM